MANFTAADVKALREETGAGMMDVKNALTEADGDREKALEIIRLKGLKSLSKREDREATAGLIVAEVAEDGKSGVMIEVNSETDFVAKTDKFIDFANQVLAAAVAAEASDLDSLLAAPAGDETVADLIPRRSAYSSSPTKTLLRSPTILVCTSPRSVPSGWTVMTLPPTSSKRNVPLLPS